MRGLGVLVLLLAAAAGTAEAGDLRVGAAAVDINPPEGTPLAGYYSPRGSRTVTPSVRLSFSSMPSSLDPWPTL